DMRWGASLTPDMQRAAREIYRSMRAEGSSGVRDWLALRFTGSRSSSTWTDLWTLATTVDFRLRTCADDDELMRVLGTDDLMELPLRRLASYIYETPRGDMMGAAHTLGVPPPEGQTDIAPTWLAQSATSHSKLEHQRRERAEAEVRHRHRASGGSLGSHGDGRGGRGGKGGRKSHGAAGAATAPDIPAARKQQAWVPHGHPGRDALRETLEVTQAVDGPASCRKVTMLEALEPEGAVFYALEQNVMADPAHRSRVNSKGLEQQHGFLGGEHSEYVEYLNRPDFAQGMRKFDAIAGAALDGPNAFSHAEVPSWMWPRQAAPPAIAADVWDLLSPALQLAVGHGGWVYPLWTRLVIGNAHSEVGAEEAVEIPALSRDLGADSRLGLTKKETFDLPMGLVVEGLVDAIAGGPPCATWSRARFAARRRSLWPRSAPAHALTAHEEQRLDEGNVATLNSFAFCEERAAATRAVFDQCTLGAPTRKPTCLAGNLGHLEEFDGRRCRGDHRHDVNVVKQFGKFVSARLATYPDRLCQAIARPLVQNFKLMLTEGSGPTGHLRAEVAVRRVGDYSWRSTGSTPRGLAVLNEASAQGRNAILRKHDLGVYLHIDVALFLSNLGPTEDRPARDIALQKSADRLEQIGSLVKDRRRQGEVNKIIGYETVDVEALRPVVGVWIWAALLARHWLSAPQALFSIMNAEGPRVRRRWASGRREVVAMMRSVMGLYSDMGAPFSPVTLATDAEGGNNHDFGGHGAVGALLGQQAQESTWEAGLRPGKALVRKPGTVEKVVKRGEARTLKPFVPVSSVPGDVLDPEITWADLLAGRRRHADNIALGEARAAIAPLEQAQHHANPWTPDEWDDTLIELKHSLRDELGKAEFIATASAVEFRFTRLKGMLACSHAAIRGWSIVFPVRRTVPMTSRPSKWIAAQMASRSRPRLGAGVALQAHIGLRPSEMLSLTTDDLTFPEDGGYHQDEGALVIGLGLKTGTTAQRAQAASLRFPKDAVFIHLLRHLRSITPPGHRLFPYPLEVYRRELAEIQRGFGIDARWTPHSPRAGYASEASALGVPFEVIGETVRWRMDSSLRIYIDVVSAAQISTALHLKGFEAALAWATQHWAWYIAQSLGQGQLRPPRGFPVAGPDSGSIVPPGSAAGPPKSLAAAVAVLAALPAAVFPATAREAETITNLVEGVGGAAKRVLASGANVTDSAARFAGASTDGTLTPGGAARKGHDLLNVTVARRAGRLFLDAQGDAPALLRSGAGSQIPQMPLEWVEELIKAGHIAMAWATSNITFQARWANPCWELLGYDFGPMTDEIGATLSRALAGASPAPNLDLSVDEIEDAPGMPSATWPFWARYI
ncbi:unnamed protein product, partial [Prorocentrum cordatum]